MTLLAGRKAIITGGASPTGIGHATAEVFARHGAQVAILDIAETDPAAVARDLGPDHLGFVCDVRDPAECTDCVDRAAEIFGGLDILVGNAGVVYGTPVLEISGE